MAAPAMTLGGSQGTAVFTDPVLFQEFQSLGSGFRQQTGKQFPINFAEFASDPGAVKALMPTLVAKAANPALSDLALAGAGAGRTALQRQLFGLPAEGLPLSSAIQALSQQRGAAQQANAQQRALGLASRQAEFLRTTQPGLALAQSMARLEPGKITTPQFNTRTGAQNFTSFQGGDFRTPAPAPVVTTAPTASTRVSTPKPVSGLERPLGRTGGPATGLQLAGNTSAAFRKSSSPTSRGSF